MNKQQEEEAIKAGIPAFLWCRNNHVCAEDGCDGTVAPHPERFMHMYCDACDAPDKVEARRVKSAKDHAAAEQAYREQRAAESAEAYRKSIAAVLGTIPARYRGIDLDTPEIGSRVRRAGALAEARAAIGAPMVTLVGGAGSGKTTLASAMLGSIVKAALAGDAASVRLALSASWISAPELARARPGQKLGEGEAPLVEEAIGCRLLVLDDVGMERQDIGGALFDVIYARHEREAMTIVTTGLTYQALIEKYGDGVARRLTEKSAATRIHCAPPATKKPVSEAT